MNLIDVFMQGGPLMFPLVLIMTVLFEITLRLLWHLFVRGGNHASAIQSCLDGLLFWGGFAVVIGVLGSALGYNKIMSLMCERGLASFEALWIGTAEGMVSAIAGLLVLTVAGSLWLVFRTHHRRMRYSR
jgi:hypothetical protein